MLTKKAEKEVRRIAGELVEEVKRIARANGVPEKEFLLRVAVALEELTFEERIRAEMRERRYLSAGIPSPSGWPCTGEPATNSTGRASDQGSRPDNFIRRPAAYQSTP